MNNFSKMSIGGGTSPFQSYNGAPGAPIGGVPQYQSIPNANQFNMIGGGLNHQFGGQPQQNLGMVGVVRPPQHQMQTMPNQYHQFANHNMAASNPMGAANGLNNLFSMQPKGSNMMGAPPVTGPQHPSHFNPNLI